MRGENVSAWEVERVFIDHPAIQACRRRRGTATGEQEILLYVQFVDEVPVEWAELVDWARPRLASYQLPRYFRQTPGFELTPSERIRKHLLPARRRGVAARIAPTAPAARIAACADAPGMRGRQLSEAWPRCLARRFGSD